MLSASEPNVVQAAEEMFQTMPLPPAMRDSSPQSPVLRHHLLLHDDRPQPAAPPPDSQCVCTPLISQAQHSFVGPLSFQRSPSSDSHWDKMKATARKHYGGKGKSELLSPALFARPFCCLVPHRQHAQCSQPAFDLSIDILFLHPSA